MKSYSLSTLMLLMVIAALTMATIVMVWQLADVRAELDATRRRFGHIRVDDESKTYVARIQNPNDTGRTSYRIRVPAGSRYLLHLSDATFAGGGVPDNPVPTKSISLNSWRDGADSCLSFAVWHDEESNAPRFIVNSESDEFFDYIPPNWTYGGEREKTFLEATPQVASSTDETIVFMHWRDSGTDRGVMVWLEPYAKWNARRLAQQAASEQTTDKSERE